MLVDLRESYLPTFNVRGISLGRYETLFYLVLIFEFLVTILQF